MDDTPTPAPPSRRAEHGHGTLDRGLAILDHLSRVRCCTTMEIVEATGLSRSTAYRLVERLREQGWLATGPLNGHWQLGPAAVRLASAAVASAERPSKNLRDAAAPALRTLAERTRETVNLGVPNGMTMVLIQRERDYAAVAATDPSVARPMHSTALGRAYLAALSREKLEETLVELVRSPASSVTSATVTELHAEIIRTQQRGWAEDRRESDEAGCCCGAAVYDHTGLPVACISVAGAAERLEPVMDTVGPLVAEVCAELSVDLDLVAWPG